MQAKLSNDHCDLSLGPDGSILKLIERASGREWQDAHFRAPMFGAICSGVAIGPTRVSQTAGSFHLEFDQIGFSCSVSCLADAEHFLFKVGAVAGPCPETLTFFGSRFAPAKIDGECHHGRALNTVWDSKFSLTLLALNTNTETRSLAGNILQGRAHQRFGLEGAACALLTVPTARLDRALVDVAAQYGLPQPTLGGQPAKLSPMIRRGYLFTDMNVENAEQILDWARRGGFRHVMVGAGSWHDRYGHYRLHPDRFPGGTATFKAIVERFHQAGIGVGIHLSSPSIGWEDPYMTPVPDRRLASGAVFRLAIAVGPTDRWLQTQAHPLVVARRVLFDYNDFGPNTAALGAGEEDALGTISIELDNAPCVVRVDDELIRVRHNLQGMGFEAIERGVYGTAARDHAAGAEIVVLRQLYGAFIMDLYSTLLGEVADSVAAIYNGCGLDMIYFDCVEGGQGPPWHSRARLHTEYLRRFDRECLVQGSDYPHLSWHWFSRYGTSDRVPTNAKAHTEHTRVPRARSCIDNRMPADMGWFQLYSESPAHPATAPDEVAHLCGRAEELGASISLQTTVQEMANNPHTTRILEIVAKHERLAGGVA